MNVTEVIERTGLKHTVVRNAIVNGSLPALKIGDNWDIDPADLEDYLSSNLTCHLGYQKYLSLRIEYAGPRHTVKVMMTEDKTTIRQLYLKDWQAALVSIFSKQQEVWWIEPDTSKKRQSITYNPFNVVGRFRIVDKATGQNRATLEHRWRTAYGMGERV